MSVSNWFETFCADIQIKQSVQDDISYRYKRITKQLNADFWNTDSDTSHSLYVGSYWRDTEIHTSDIDMIFELPNSVYKQYDEYEWNWQSGLLQAVRNSLRKTYPSSYTKADGQVVGVNFTDGICYEIVPVFVSSSGNYLYPDSNDWWSWKVTKPKLEIKAIKDRNDACNGNLKRLCRMMRSWKDKWSVPMWWLLIDTLAYRFIESWTYKDKSYLYYDFMARDFFKYLNEQDKDKEYWLAAGSEQYVYKKWNFQDKAGKCYDLCVEAITKEKTYPFTAKSKWREIFGTKFPS